jgi:hypothetical protein
MTKIAGIDVDVLADAIRQMDSGAHTLSSQCLSLTSQFDRYGLDTSNLRRLSAIASWTRDQLPDLRRRHAVAVHFGDGDPFVKITEPYSVAAADAYLFQQATKGRDKAGLALVKSDLRKHMGDQEFLSEYEAATPDGVTAFQGLPADEADKLNRIRLAKCVKAKDCPQQLKDLAAYLVKNQMSQPLLLGFDGKGKGHVVLSFGNPDTAANTAVYVPGTGAHGTDGDMDRALTMFESANAQKPGSTASVYWLGYDAPTWSLPGPASQSFADTAGPELSSFVRSLQANHSGRGHLTVIGHSYGTTVVGDACAHFGMRPDDVVFVGSPGVTVGRASQLGIDPSHVWASHAKFDPVPSLAPPLDPYGWANDHSDRYGNDPTSSTFGGKTFDSGSGSGAGHAHSEYWDPGPSLTNMTDIVIGRPEKVTPMPDEDKIGVLPADPLNGADDVGSILENSGHAIGGYWGAPVEDLGDTVHAAGTVADDISGSGADALTGDFGGALHDVEDTGDALKDTAENGLHTVTDFF